MTAVADISVIIPAYNAAQTIARAVASVLDQNVAVREILIYDDASTDETRDILRDLTGSHSNISVVHGAGNQGAGVARSTLLASAIGSYFAFLDADDVWHQNKIGRQIEYLKKTNADVTYSGHRILDENGATIGLRAPPERLSYRQLLMTNYIATSSAIVSAKLVNSRRMPNLRRRQDYGYWISLFQSNPGLKAVGIPDPLLDYYRLSGSLSSDPIRNLSSNYSMFRDAAGFGPIAAAGLTLTNAFVRALRA